MPRKAPPTPWWEEASTPPISTKLWYAMPTHCVASPLALASPLGHTAKPEKRKKHPKLPKDEEGVNNSIVSKAARYLAQMRDLNAPPDPNKKDSTYKAKSKEPKQRKLWFTATQLRPRPDQLPAETINGPSAWRAIVAREAIKQQEAEQKARKARRKRLVTEIPRLIEKLKEQGKEVYPHLYWTPIERAVEAEEERRDREKQEKEEKKIAKRKGKPVAGRCWKIRVYPTEEQQVKLRKWFEAARWTYNQALDIIAGRHPGTEGKPVTNLRLKKIRSLCVNEEALRKEPNGKELLEVPYEIRDAAAVEAVNAYKACEAKRQKYLETGVDNNGGSRPFVIKHRSPNAKSQTILVCNDKWNQERSNSMYSWIFSAKALRAKMLLPDDIGYDCRLQKLKFGGYYLCLVMAPREPRTDMEPIGGVIALDPGALTFQTGYSDNGNFYEFGKKDINRITRLSRHVDSLMRKAYARQNSDPSKFAEEELKRKEEEEQSKKRLAKKKKKNEANKRRRARKAEEKREKEEKGKEKVGSKRKRKKASGAKQPAKKRTKSKKPKKKKEKKDKPEIQVEVVPKAAEEEEYGEGAPHPDVNQEPYMVKHRTRVHLRRKATRLRAKSERLVVELHRQLARWLCKTHKVILLPSFNTGEMVNNKRSKKRRISGRTARQMLNWRHFQFRERLLHKAKEHPDCHVVITTEEYTSKTCGQCGWLNNGLTCADRTWRCGNKECKVKHDRDMNAGRNILLRYLSKEKIATW